MNDVNPLNLINRYFHIEFWNPTPRMTALKGGDRFTLTMEIDKETFDLFCGAPNDTRAGMILEGALKVTQNHGAIGTCDDEGELLVPGTMTLSPAQETEAKGVLAKEMYRNGYFNNPSLWAVLMRERVYTGDMHRDFLSAKPCICCSTTRNQKFHALIGFSDPIPCDGTVVWHHIRTSANSGTGFKPHDFITVPVCGSHHRAAHDDQTRHLNEWLLTLAASYRAEGIAQAIKRGLGLESMSALTPALLDSFHNLIGFRG